MGNWSCGTLAEVMSQTAFKLNAPFPHASQPGSGRRWLAALFCACAVTLGLAPFAGADDASTINLAFAEDDAEQLLRELEEASRRENALLRREAEAEAARAREIEAKKRRITDQNEQRRRLKQDELQQRIDREKNLQNEMFDRKKRNETTATREHLGAHAGSSSGDLLGQTSPRLAPGEPTLRELPRAIFSEKSITIAPGTPGFDNKKKRKVTKLVLDADRDGNPEVVRFIDRKSKALIRQEEDRDYDGNKDAVLRFERGRITSQELDTNNDGRPDIWERYEKGRQVERKLDRDHDGVADAFYEFEGKYLVRERHDANNDSEFDLHVEYRKGRRAKAREDTDRDGRVDTWIRYGFTDGREIVTHIELDKSGRGFADTFESFEANGDKTVIARREEDLDGDGEIDMVSIYRRGKLVRREILKPEVVPL